MEEMINMLNKRKEELLKIKKEKEKSLENVPPGFLRICSARKTPQYYQRTNPKDKIGTYIPQKDFNLARDLAQKDYDQKIIRSIDEEIQAINKYLSSLPKIKMEEVYGRLHPGRQKLITPIRETDEQYIKKWEEIEYFGKEIDDTVPLLLTERGERVRSKSEMIIADILSREGIPYRYECPLLLKDFGRVYPDFTTLNIKKRKEIYWEHLGMMDEPAYVEAALCKLEAYKKNGIVLGGNLIVTWETKKYPINQGKIKKTIKEYFAG